MSSYGNFPPGHPTSPPATFPSPAPHQPMPPGAPWGAVAPGAPWGAVVPGFVPPGAARTGIEVTMGFFPLAFLLFMCTPVVEINNIPKPFGWGRHFIDLPPGRYVVSIYFPYMLSSRCGMNSCEVHLQPGMVRRVNYYMWPLMFIPGTMSVT